MKSSDTVSTTNNRQFNDLLFEYYKLKTKFGKLCDISTEILRENDELKKSYASNELEMKKLVQDKETMHFRNKQLTKRLEVFQKDYHGLKECSKHTGIDNMSTKSISNDNESLLEEKLRRKQENLEKFVDVTKTQVANLSAENFELNMKLKTITENFETELSSKYTQLEDCEAEIKRLNDELKEKNEVAKLGKHCDNNNVFVKESHDGEQLHDNIRLYDKNIFDNNMRINNAPLKKINYNEKIVLKFLQSFVALLKNFCNDISNAVRNSNSVFDSNHFYDFTNAMSLIQGCFSDLKKYKNMHPFVKNRFEIIEHVLNKCNRSFEVISTLIDYFYKLDSNKNNIFKFSHCFQTLNNLKLYIYTVLCSLKQLVTVYNKASNDFAVENGSVKWWVCDDSSLQSYPEKSNSNKISLKLYIDKFAKETFIFIEEKTNEFISKIKNIRNTPVDEMKHFELFHTDRQGIKELYFHISSLLKSRSVEIIETFELFVILLKHERLFTENHGFCLTYMWISDVSDLKTYDLKSHCYSKMVSVMKSVNQELNSSVFDHASESILVKKESHDDNTVNAYKYSNQILQDQLINTFKKIDEVHNANELLKFKIETNHFCNAEVACDSEAQKKEINKLDMGKLSDYLQNRISHFQLEHQKSMSQVNLLLSDWKCSQLRLKDCERKVEQLKLENQKLKNEYESVSNYLSSMKDSYEQNVLELTEKLSIQKAKAKVNKKY